MGSVLSIAQRFGKGFVQMLIRVIDLKSPQLHITGNVNFGTNHGTFNQQHFFQGWLDTTRQPPAAIELDSLGTPPGPCVMPGTFCHVPTHTSTSPGPTRNQGKQIGGQDERELSPRSPGSGKSASGSADARQESIGSAPFVSPGNSDLNLLPPGSRGPPLPAPGNIDIETLEDHEVPSNSEQGAQSAAAAEGKLESDCALDKVQLKKASKDTEQAALAIEVAPSTAGPCTNTQASPEAQHQSREVVDYLDSPAFEDNLKLVGQFDINEPLPSHSRRPNIPHDISASPEDTAYKDPFTPPATASNDREIPGGERQKGTARRGSTSTQKKSVIASAIASIGLGKAKGTSMKAEKEKATLLVDDLERELRELEDFAKQLAKDAVDWARLTTKAIGALRTWSVSLWKSISLIPDAESEAFDAFLEVVERQLLPLCVDLEAALNDQLLKGIAHLLKTMNQPYGLLATMREQESVHYQYLSTPPKSKRNNAYAAMRATSDSYVAIRAQLLEDLPKYTHLLHRGVMVSVRRLAAIQGRFWKDVRDKWGELWEMLRVDGEINAGYEETINVWSARWMDIDEVLSSLYICQARNIYQEPERGRRRAASSSSNVSRRVTIDIPSSPHLPSTPASIYISSPMPFVPSTRSRSRNSEESSHRLPRRSSSHSRERWPEPRRGRPRASSSSEIHGPFKLQANTPEARGRPFADMPSAPNGAPLRPAHSSKRHRSTGRDLPLPQVSTPKQPSPSAEPVSWATKPAMYMCMVIHPCKPPPVTPYFNFPFLTLHAGEFYEILKEAGHPSTHPKLPLYVDEGEDCLLLCRGQQGVGWALASFLKPVNIPASR